MDNKQSICFTVKAGAKEFLYVLIWVAVIAAAGEAVAAFIPNPPILKNIFTIALMCAAVYFVYKKYCAVFTYELGGEELILKERIGRRERISRVEYKDIEAITDRAADGVQKEVYTKSIIGTHSRRYIKCGGRVLVVDAGEEFCAKLEEKING